MKKLCISFLIVFVLMTSISINNFSYLTNYSFSADTIVLAKGSSGGYRSGGFSSGTRSKGFNSGTYSAPKSNTKPKAVTPPATNGSTQTRPRTSFFPMFIPMPFGWGGGYGMYNPFAGIFQLIILVGIILAVIWFIRKRRSK